MNKRLLKSGKEPIPVIRIHDLRHTHASLLLNPKEVNHLQVSNNLGHAIMDNTTTKRYYHDDGNRDDIIKYFEKVISSIELE